MQHSYHDNNDAGDDDASTLESKSLGPGGGGSVSGFSLPRMVTAGDELESLCRAEMSGGNRDGGGGGGVAVLPGFPPTSLQIARLLGGNHCCVDCGDEDRDALRYASIGYGTILCRECAHRHVTMSPEESNVKSITEDHWNFRSILTILEGSNLSMLDYLKDKPRWRSPKGMKDVDSQDVLAFKQIYLSKGAATYRKDLAKRVDDAFYERITAMRDEDAAREERAAMLGASSYSGGEAGRDNRFRHIFEQNDVPAEEIPNFFGEKTKLGKDDAYDGGGAAGVGRRGRRSTAMSLMKHEPPSIDLIRERINRRRGMNSTIAESMQESPNSSRGGSEPRISPPSADPNVVAQVAAGYAPQGRRAYGRMGSHLVGEVGDSSIQGRDEGTVLNSIASGSYRRWSGGQQAWPQQDAGQMPTTYSMHSSRPVQPLGTYRRATSSEADGGLAGQPVSRGG